MRPIIERLIIIAALAMQFALVSQSGGIFADEYAVIGIFDREHPIFEAMPMDSVVQRLLNHPIETSAGRYMPLVRPILYLEYLAFGDNFVARYAFECALWIICALLLYSMAGRISTSPGAGFCAGLFLALVWPVAGLVVRVQNTEPFFLIMHLTAYLCIWKVESIAQTNRSSGGIRTIWASMFVKETALVVIPGFVMLGVLGTMFRPARMRKHYAVIAIATLVIGLGAIYNALSARGSQGYSSAYNLSDIWVVLEQATRWRELFSSGFGPLLPIAVVLLIIRITKELRRGAISRSSLWRASLLFYIIGFFLLHAPWPSITPRYAFPGFAIMGLLVACEIADLWKWTTDNRTAEVRDYRRSPGVGLLLACCWAWWLVPNVKVPVVWSELVAKILVGVIIVLISRRIMRIRSGPMKDRLSLNGALSRGVGASLVVGSVYVLVVSMSCRANIIYHRTGVTYSAHQSLFEVVDEHAAPGGRVVIAFDQWQWSDNFTGYRDRNFERRDYRYVPQFGEHLRLRPNDMLICQAKFLENPPDAPPPLDASGREFLQTEMRMTAINPYFLHPGRLMVMLTGNDTMTDIRTAMKWPALTREIDYGWRIYLPLTTDSASES